MDYSALNGKTISLVVMTRDEKGEGEYEVFPGRMAWSDGLLYFDPGNGDEPFPIPEEFYEHIAPVDENLRDVMRQSEFMLPFGSGLDNGEDTGDDLEDEDWDDGREAGPPEWN